MTKRIVFCEGRDDLNALRAVAQRLRWAEPAGSDVRDLAVALKAADGTRIEIKVPSKARGATGEGKSALARAAAAELQILRPQVDPADESRVSLVAVVFDPDEKAPADFHDDLTRAIREFAPAWTLTGTAGTWQAQREAAEQVEVRAVHWRAPGPVLDGLPDHVNLERLLCAVVAKAYPDDEAHVARWLTEMRARCTEAGRKLPTWKAAIHIWLAIVHEKADEDNAASRFLHQQDKCKPHVQPILEEVGLLAELRPLLGPA